MKTTEKNLIKLLLLISIIALFNGCVAKRANGTYKSTYSYHPYIKRNMGNRFFQPIQQSRQYNPNNSIQRLTKLALSQMGKEYKWGATGPYTFDCSGFTKFVYSQNKVTLPRVSKEQAKIGQFVSRQNLKKGDLVFFSTSKSSEVGHVGIYLGGDQFIHASSSKHRVVISSINSNYYSNHFKWGRRYFR